MALPALDIHVPPAAFDFLPVCPDFAQQSRWKVHGTGTPFASGTANDLHHRLCNDRSYRPR